MGFDFTHDAGIGYFLAAISGDVFIPDGEEGVGAGDPLALPARTRTDALAEAAKFVGVGGVPDVFVEGVLAQLAVTQGLAGCVHDWHGPCSEEAGREAAGGGGVRRHVVGEVLKA